MQKKKKGFTLVELLVVIAILAILAGVSVVGYLSFTEKAKESNDQTLVKQLNTILQADESLNGKPKTMQEALDTLVENGYLVEKLTPTSGKNEFVWNEITNEFEIVKNDTIETYKEPNKWLIVHSLDSIKTYNDNFSLYLSDNVGDITEEISIVNGLDTGNVKTSNIKYVNQDKKEVTFKTNSGILEIDAPNDVVNHYGLADNVNIINVAENSYHEYGIVKNEINLSNGHVKLESTSQCPVISVKTTSVKITNSTNKTISVAGEKNVLDSVLNKIKGSFVKTEVSSEQIAASEKFSGGYGTKELPYLIGTEKQLKNIMSNTGKYYYFKLINDITITIPGSSAHLFNPIWRSYLDGDNHTITATADKPIFKGVDEGELKNIILDVKGGTPILNCENSTLENITVNGFVTGTQNDSCFVTYPKGKTTYNNITINASLEGSGGNTNYNAVFFGNVANATEINLSNAVFNGELHSGSAALIIANPNYAKYILKLNNVKNNGVIRAIANPNSMCSKFNPIVSITNDGTHTLSKYFIDGVEYKPSQILDITPSYFGGSFVLGEIDPNLNLVVNEDNTISITPSLNLNVDHYVISVGIYAISKTGGTHINRIEETLMQGETVTTTLKKLEFVDSTWVKNNPAATKVENENYTVYSLEGKEYYLLSSVETDTLNGTPKMTEMITITAYSKTNQVLFSKSI